MRELFTRLNYKGNRRIAVLNAEEDFFNDVLNEFKETIIDKEIDQRCPYEFIIIFVKSVKEVEHFAPIVFHNLTADGILWFCYPKKSSKIFSSELERNRGWNVLNDSGFHSVRMVSIDENWSAMRFRNIKYIKSTSGRFNK